jgi:hypothetical protein
MGLVAREGLLMAIVLTILPFAILRVLVKLLPPWPEASLPEAEPRNRRRQQPVQPE